MTKSIKKISPEELKAIDDIANNMANIKHHKTKVKKDYISFMCADKFVSDLLSTMEKYLPIEKKENIANNINDKNYNEIIRFKLVDKKNRLFVMMLNFTLTDEDNFWVSKWEYVGERGRIKEVVDKYLPYIEYGVISGFQPNWALSPMESSDLDT